MAAGFRTAIIENIRKTLKHIKIVFSKNAKRTQNTYDKSIFGNESVSLTSTINTPTKILWNSFLFFFNFNNGFTKANMELF